jgi:hypothetical protein
MLPAADLSARESCDGQDGADDQQDDADPKQDVESGQEQAKYQQDDPKDDHVASRCGVSKMLRVIIKAQVCGMRHSG